jgi:hypothetical protein
MVEMECSEACQKQMVSAKLTTDIWADDPSISDGISPRNPAFGTRATGCKPT